MEDIKKSESLELGYEPDSRAETGQINPGVVFSGRYALHASVGRGLVGSSLVFTGLALHDKVVLSRIHRTSLWFRA